MPSRIYALIFARGGSKGLPGKNIKIFNGKPLIAWTVELARSMGIFDRLIVSTDSDEIAEIAQRYGAEIPFLRPAELASDTCPERLAWRHAVENLPPFDIMVSLPAVAPLRRSETVHKCIELFKKGDADTVITVTPASRHPAFNMVRIDAEGYSKTAIAKKSPICRRQDAGEFFDMSTVCYVTSPNAIMKQNSIFDGKVRHIIIDREESIDIDTIFDFEIAQWLHAKRNKNIII